jgi:hypothetical protein
VSKFTIRGDDYNAGLIEVNIWIYILNFINEKIIDQMQFSRRCWFQHRQRGNKTFKKTKENFEQKEQEKKGYSMKWQKLDFCQIFSMQLYLSRIRNAYLVAEFFSSFPYFPIALQTRTPPIWISYFFRLRILSPYSITKFIMRKAKIKTLDQYDITWTVNKLGFAILKWNL